MPKRHFIASFRNEMAAIMDATSNFWNEEGSPLDGFWKWTTWAKFPGLSPSLSDYLLFGIYWRRGAPATVRTHTVTLRETEISTISTRRVSTVSRQTLVTGKYSNQQVPGWIIWSISTREIARIKNSIRGHCRSYHIISYIRVEKPVDKTQHRI